MDPISPWPPPDPLGEALHFLRMDGAFYSRSELSAPWGMTLSPMPGHLWFHVVTTGRALLETDDAHPVWLQPGDFALVPHGEGTGCAASRASLRRTSSSSTCSPSAIAMRSSATAGAARPPP